MVDPAKKYRLIALARQGWYAPGLEDMEQEIPDTINGHMLEGERDRQMMRSHPGLSYSNYKVGRSRKPSKSDKGLGISNQAFNYYRATGDY